MAFTEKPPPLPPPTQPVIDPDTGVMTQPWYDFLTRLRGFLARMGAAIP